MPGVVIAIAGLIISSGIIGSGVVASYIAVGIAAFLVTAGAGLVVYGVGTLISAAGSALGSGGANAGVNLSAVVNPLASWNVQYGRCRVGGTVVFRNSFGDNDKYLDLVMILACHPCESVDWLMFDNQKVQIGSIHTRTHGWAGTSFTPLQQTISIPTTTAITRENNVVTVKLDHDIPLLEPGDQLIIQGVHPVNFLFNGKFPVTSVVHTPGFVVALTFTYLSGGPAVPSGVVTESGQVITTWSDYQSKIYMEVMLGSQALGETFQGMLSGTPYDGNWGGGFQQNNDNPWTADCSLLGKTAVFLRLHYNETVFANGVPMISFLIRGKNDIADYRTSPPTVGYTENAALCIADHLSNTTWGYRAVYGTEIPLTPLNAAANVCDERVALAVPNTSPPTTEARYTCNGGFPLSVHKGEILQNMLTSCAGRLVYSGGQFVIWPAAWYGVTATITSSQMLSMLTGPFRWRSTQSVTNLFNGVKGTYVCPVNNWTPADFPRYAQDTIHGYTWGSSPQFDANLDADGGDRRWLDVQLPFTISTSMAQRIAKIELLRRRRQGTGTFPLNMAGYQFTPMDVLALDLTYFGWTGKHLEVLAARFKMDKQSDAGGYEVAALGTEIDVQETDSSVYAWDIGEELSPEGYQQAIVPDNRTPAAPTDVLLSTVGGSIIVDWTSPADGFVLNGGYLEVQYQLVVSPEGLWLSLGQFDPTRTEAEVDNLDAGDYFVRIQSVNAAGVPSPWVLGSPVTSSPLTPGPITVTGFIAAFPDAENVLSTSTCLVYYCDMATGARAIDGDGYGFEGHIDLPVDISNDKNITIRVIDPLSPPGVHDVYIAYDYQFTSGGSVPWVAGPYQRPEITQVMASATFLCANQDGHVTSGAFSITGSGITHALEVVGHVAGAPLPVSAVVASVIAVGIEAATGIAKANVRAVITPPTGWDAADIQVWLQVGPSSPPSNPTPVFAIKVSDIVSNTVAFWVDRPKVDSNACYLWVVGWKDGRYLLLDVAAAPSSIKSNAFTLTASGNCLADDITDAALGTPAYPQDDQGIYYCSLPYTFTNPTLDHDVEFVYTTITVQKTDASGTPASDREGEERVIHQHWTAGDAVSDFIEITIPPATNPDGSTNLFRNYRFKAYCHNDLGDPTAQTTAWAGTAAADFVPDAQSWSYVASHIPTGYGADTTDGVLQASTVGDGLIPNGDFEIPEDAVHGSTDIAHWTNVGCYVEKSGPVFSGSQCVSFPPNVTSLITSEPIPLISTKGYVFSAQLIARSTPDAPILALVLFFDKTGTFISSSPTVYGAPGDYITWGKMATGFTAPAATATGQVVIGLASGYGNQLHAGLWTVDAALLVRGADAIEIPLGSEFIVEPDGSIAMDHVDLSKALNYSTEFQVVAGVWKMKAFDFSQGFGGFTVGLNTPLISCPQITVTTSAGNMGWIGFDATSGYHGAWFKRVTIGGTSPASAGFFADSSGNVVAASILIGDSAGTYGWIGSGGGYTGAWFQRVLIGGTAPAGAIIIADSAGNVAINGATFLLTSGGAAISLNNHTLGGGIKITNTSNSDYAIAVNSEISLYRASGANPIKLSNLSGKGVIIVGTEATASSKCTITADSAGANLALQNSGGSILFLDSNAAGTGMGIYWISTGARMCRDNVTIEYAGNTTCRANLQADSAGAHIDLQNSGGAGFGLQLITSLAGAGMGVYMLGHKIIGPRITMGGSTLADVILALQGHGLIT